MTKQSKIEGYRGYTPAHFNFNAGCRIPAYHTVAIFDGDSMVLEVRGHTKSEAEEAARREYPRVEIID